MIKADRILLYINVLQVPFIMDEAGNGWELAEFAEEYAYNIAKRNRQKTEFSLNLAPSRHAGRNLVKTETFQSVYRKNVIKVLDKVDAVAYIPCLGKASEIPDWLKTEADNRYIMIAPFSSFFEKPDGDSLYVETSRRRMLLTRVRRPEGREGRGSRQK